MAHKESKNVKNVQELVYLVQYDMKNDILAIKAVAEERHLTTAQIQRMLEAKKEFLSPTTIRRVLEPSSENKSFNWDTTIRPLKRVLLEDQPVPEDTITAQIRLEGLEAVCTRQEELIEALRDQMRQMKEDHARICAQYEDGISLCKEQIVVKDRRMDLKDTIIADLMKKNDDLLAELRRRQA